MALITSQTQELKLSNALGLPNSVWLKREDLHPYGSHKGRSIPHMIDAYVKRGIKDFVISSSGNAALAAALYIKDEPLRLTIFVGKNIDKEKYKSLKSKITTAKAGSRFEAVINHKSKILIKQVTNPKQTAFQMDKSGQAKLLRQSSDDIALAGYEELAKELSEIKDLSAVFIPTSSGTTAEGLYLGFKELGLNPQIHIVQTDAVHPMITTSPPPAPSIATKGGATTPLRSSGGASGEDSLASAIVDKVGYRKDKVLDAIKNSRGAGWIGTNTEIVQAIKLVKKTTGLEISPNSALAIAGLLQAINAGWKWNGPVVCLVTGQ